VSRPFAGGSTVAVVTTGAETGRLGFVVSKGHAQWDPGSIGMTGLTVIAALWMVGAFTRRQTLAVMTAAAETGRSGLAVIEGAQ